MKKLLLLLLLCPAIALAQQFESRTTASGSGSTVIQAAQIINRRMLMIQACSSNTANVYICFATNNVCTAAAAAFELVPGGSFGPITSGMYTGMTQSMLAGSQIFTADVAFLPVSGSQCVHALID